MKEQLFLETIKSIIGDKYIGDDCAYLKDLGIVVTQDSLVEDVHFKMDYFTPAQLGYKSIMVNISDVTASGAVPRYVSIALSLPTETSKDFIKEFYTGVKKALDLYDNVEIIGGDITGSDKIVVSICAIGLTSNCKISSRADAQEDQIIVTTGFHGSSSGGLELLLNGSTHQNSLIEAHISPCAKLIESQLISKNIDEPYAMMDTSDGLVDALYKIAKASKKTLVVDFDKIKFDAKLKELFPDNYIEKILYGGEDYQLVATVPKSLLPKLNSWYEIGVVKLGSPVLQLNMNKKTIIIDNIDKCYNHFNV